MRIKIDEANDALYFRLDESAIVESEAEGKTPLLSEDGSPFHEVVVN
jgi:hypothetical protein